MYNVLTIITLNIILYYEGYNGGFLSGVGLPWTPPRSTCTDVMFVATLSNRCRLARLQRQGHAGQMGERSQ